MSAVKFNKEVELIDENGKKSFKKISSEEHIRVRLTNSSEHIDYGRIYNCGNRDAVLDALVEKEYYSDSEKQYKVKQTIHATTPIDWDRNKMIFGCQVEFINGITVFKNNK